MSSVEMQQIQGYLTRCQNAGSLDELRGINQEVYEFATRILPSYQDRSPPRELSGLLIRILETIANKLSTYPEIAPAIQSIATTKRTVVAQHGTALTISLQGAAADTSDSSIGESAKLLVVAGASQEIAALLIQKTLGSLPP